jgi:mannose-1-phosphate guanylyltransferase/mannose-6-phosphate isomerase
VARFTEKPGRETAQRFVASGRHFWNAGIFVWPLPLVEAEFASHEPEVAGFMREVRAGGEWPLSPQLAARFAGLPSISVDYAVMERTRNIRLLPLRCGWNDLGSFSGLAEALGADASGNSLSLAGGAKALAEGCRGVLLHEGSAKRVALVGASGLIVVDTPEALLVCAREEEGAVKEVGRRMEREAPAEPTWDQRPWGSWETLSRGPGFQVKRIAVRPGQRLSLQAHQHRSEHWVVLSGRPLVEVDGRPLEPSPGQHVFIPQGSRHRLANPAQAEAVIIEVQLGEVLSEGDIVRYEDDYGRA